MIRKFKAKITYTTDSGHPDTKEIKRMSFEDVYKIDENCYFGYDHMMSYIKKDLRLVAGGGYNTDHIHNVEFNITEI